MTAMNGDGDRATAPRGTPNLKLDLPLPEKVEGMQAPKKAWNTKNLGLRLASDAISAASAAALVAPVVSIIDR